MNSTSPTLRRIGKAVVLQHDGRPPFIVVRHSRTAVRNLNHAYIKLGRPIETLCVSAANDRGYIVKLKRTALATRFFTAPSGLTVEALSALEEFGL